MGSLLHLQDAHERAQMLMPWRVNGTLDEAETALFDAHLGECAECRAELEAEFALRAAVADMPVPQAGARVPAAARVNAPARHRPGRRRFLARRVPMGWVLAAPAAAAAAAAAVAIAVFPTLPPAERNSDADYRLLASEEAAPAGNVIVMFTADATERELRAALDQVGGRIVDGPTASGAYIVRVAPAERPAALARLRSVAPVALAEPVDAPATP